MISGPVLMNIYVGDGELHASEKEFVYTEGNIMDGGGNVAVPVNDSGGTAPIKADGGIDVQDQVRVPVYDSGGAAPVLSDDRGDTRDPDKEGRVDNDIAVHVPVNSGGDIEEVLPRFMREQFKSQ